MTIRLNIFEFDETELIGMQAKRGLGFINPSFQFTAKNLSWTINMILTSISYLFQIVGNGVPVIS